jgi:hypothetical protein
MFSLSRLPPKNGASHGLTTAAGGKPPQRHLGATPSSRSVPLALKLLRFRMCPPGGQSSEQTRRSIRDAVLLAQLEPLRHLLRKSALLVQPGRTA